VPKNKDRNCHFSVNPLPLQEGTEGRRNISDDITPSPIEGEGTIKKVLRQIWDSEDKLTIY